MQIFPSVVWPMSSLILTLSLTRRKLLVLMMSTYQLSPSCSFDHTVGSEVHFALTFVKDVRDGLGSLCSLREKTSLSLLYCSYSFVLFECIYVGLLRAHHSVHTTICLFFPSAALSGLL